MIDHIKATCRSFLWSGSECSGRAPIEWDSVCKPKADGGLNIVNLKRWNQTALGKLLWNIHMKVDRLWFHWLDTFYFKGRDILQWHITSTSSWILKKICMHKDNLMSNSNWSKVILEGRYNIGSMYKALYGDYVHMGW